jgi:hypothetical protein
MAKQDERLVTFYIEHYRQMNDAVRYTERNTQAFIGFYIALTAGVQGFLRNDHIFSLVAGIFLFLLGIPVAFYVCRARYWHCEHTEVAKAVHQMFVGNTMNLLEAANSVVKTNKEIESRKPNFAVSFTNGVFFNKFWKHICFNRLDMHFKENRGWSFFNPDGAEFWLYLFVLLLTGANGANVVLSSHDLQGLFWLLSVLAALVFLAVIFFGVWWYRGYLESREDSFPDKSPFIMKRENEGGQGNVKS